MQQRKLFSVDPTDAPKHWKAGKRSRVVFTVGPCPFRDNSFRAVTSSSSGRSMRRSKQAARSRSAEEYKKSACEDLTCDLKTLCVL
jgi:hypothetical protein